MNLFVGVRGMFDGSFLLLFTSLADISLQRIESAGRIQTGSFSVTKDVKFLFLNIENFDKY